MKKKRLVMLLVLFLFVLSIAVSIFFSNLLFLSLNGEITNIKSLTTLLSVSGILHNEEQRLLFLLSLFMCSLIFVVLFFINKDNETFESKTDVITEKIRTPVALGQGQHGTARWLKQDEIAHLFSILTIDPSEEKYLKLIADAHFDKENCIQGGRKNESKK